MDTNETTPRAGTIRVAPAADYDRDGFVVEQFTYGNSHEPHWCVPGWLEDRWGEDGFFDTEAAARDFLEMITRL